MHSEDIIWCPLSVKNGFWIHSSLLKDIIELSLKDTTIEFMTDIEKLYWYLIQMSNVKLISTKHYVEILNTDMIPYRNTKLHDFLSKYLQEEFIQKYSSDWSIINLTRKSELDHIYILLDISNMLSEDILYSTYLPHITLLETYELSSYTYFFKSNTNINKNIQKFIDQFSKTRIAIVINDDYELPDNTHIIDNVALKYSKFIMLKEKIHINIQDVHGDETSTLVNLIESMNYKVSYFKYFNKEDYNKYADILILPGNDLSLPYINCKKFLLTFVGNILIKRIEHITSHPNFRGFICTSAETYKTVIENGMKAIFIYRKYPFTVKDIQPVSEYNSITSIISDYKKISPTYKVEGSYSYDRFIELCKLVPNIDIKTYGDGEDTCNDIEVLKKSRYLIHIKYWGHVCNAVVKALAIGVPIIMDIHTYNIGKYSAYIFHNHNAMVFNTIDEISYFLNNDIDIYPKLKETCMKEATKYHYNYDLNEEEKIYFENMIK
jgi:hypothetical protein